MPSKQRDIFFFGNGKAEGNAKMRNLLGGKGAGLHEMTRIGIPVPPGFTISTEVCSYYYSHSRRYPRNLEAQFAAALTRTEKTLGRRFGDSENPLLVSVRSGARESMPGMMDTVLNLGLNDKSVEGLAKKTENERFAWDSYRRFVQMFGNVCRGVPGEKIEDKIKERKREAGVTEDTELTTDDLEKLTDDFKQLYKDETKED